VTKLFDLPFSFHSLPQITPS